MLVVVCLTRLLSTEGMKHEIMPKALLGALVIPSLCLD